MCVCARVRACVCARQKKEEETDTAFVTQHAVSGCVFSDVMH